MTDQIPIKAIKTGAVATALAEFGAGDQIPAAHLLNAPSSFRNLLINGNFDIWQRGTSNAAHTTQAYLADRWLSGGSGSTIACSQQAFTYGQNVVPYNPQFFQRLVVSSVAGASNYAFFGQKLEWSDKLSGKTVTVSFWAKADSAKSLAITFTQNFGVGGSATVGIPAASTIAITTTWQKYTYTIAIPSVAGATKGTGNYLAMYIYLDAGANISAAGIGQQSGTWDFSQFQIEIGNVATDFELRDAGEEIRACYRYCYVWNSVNSYQTFGLGYAYSATTLGRVTARYPTPMRAAPTVAFTGTLRAEGGNGVTSSCSLVTNYPNAFGFEGDFGVSGLTAGQAYVLEVANGGTFVADAEL